jgi:hypothetical protein
VYENGNDAQQNFIQNLAIFFCTLFSNHIKDLESVKENHQLLLEAHWYLLGISEVSDVEVWKICLDYWNKLVRRVHLSRALPSFLALTSLLSHGQASEVYDEPPVMQAASPLMLGGSLGVSTVSPRRALYAPIFSRGTSLLFTLYSQARTA